MPRLYRQNVIVLGSTLVPVLTYPTSSVVPYTPLLHDTEWSRAEEGYEWVNMQRGADIVPF